MTNNICKIAIAVACVLVTKAELVCGIPTLLPKCPSQITKESTDPGKQQGLAGLKFSTLHGHHLKTWAKGTDFSHLFDGFVGMDSTSAPGEPGPQTSG